MLMSDLSKRTVQKKDSKIVNTLGTIDRYHHTANHFFSKRINGLESHLYSPNYQ